jgi:hypothetical protein
MCGMEMLDSPTKQTWIEQLKEELCTRWSITSCSSSRVRLATSLLPAELLFGDFKTLVASHLSKTS